MCLTTEFEKKVIIFANLRPEETDFPTEGDIVVVTTLWAPQVSNRWRRKRFTSKFNFKTERVRLWFRMSCEYRSPFVNFKRVFSENKLWFDERLTLKPFYLELLENNFVTLKLHGRKNNRMSKPYSSKHETTLSKSSLRPKGTLFAKSSLRPARGDISLWTPVTPSVLRGWRACLL